MTRTLPFALILAILLLTGCISLPGSACTPEVFCDKGILMERACQGGQGTTYNKSSVFSCSNNLVLVHSCRGDQLAETRVISVKYCGEDGKFRVVTCSGGVLDSEVYNQLMYC